MEIKIESTANKNILKFVASFNLVEGSYQISQIEEAQNIPLAQKLLQFPFVKQIFITANFIGIQKIEDLDWVLVQDEIKEIIEIELKENQYLIKRSTQPIQIYMERTPNDQVMKFVTDRLLINGIIEIKDKNDTEKVPLATYLFSFTYVKEVFISENYISITKMSNYDWNDITNEIRSALSKYLEEGREISTITHFSTYKKQQIGKQINKKHYTNKENRIKDILDEYVLPAVSGDGGNIDLVSYDENLKVVHVVLQGACNGCPSSTMTLKNGIENLLKEMLPNEIERVEAINE